MQVGDTVTWQGFSLPNPDQPDSLPLGTTGKVVAVYGTPFPVDVDFNGFKRTCFQGEVI